MLSVSHDDVIKWKLFPRYWPFVRGIHRSPVNSPHKGQWRGALMFSLICVWINGWVNNREAGDLRRYLAHYDVTLIITLSCVTMGQWVKCVCFVNFNTMGQRQNGCHFATDDILTFVFLYENCRSFIQTSLQFVPKGLIYNKPAFVQKNVWCRSGNKPTHVWVTRPR